MFRRGFVAAAVGIALALGAISTAGAGIGPVPYDAWFAEGQNLLGSGKRFDAWGICSSDNLRYREILDPAPAGTAGTTEANCPPGKSIVSGGFRTSPGNVVRSLPTDGTDGDRRPDDAWTVKTYSESGLQERSSIAICKKVGRGELAKRVERARVRDDVPKTIRASCPKDKAAAGVGFSIGGPAAESFIHAVKPLDSKDKGKAPDDRWAVTFVNMSEATRTATVRALCVG